MKKPEIICLCGSMRFLNDILLLEQSLSFKRKIVLSPSVKTIDVERNINLSKYKPMLDELHLRKIDISDSIFVVNIGGYIGKSTRNEINYALKEGKKVLYLEPPQNSC